MFESFLDTVHPVLTGFLILWVIMVTNRMRDQDKQLADLWQTMNELADRVREGKSDA